jgi:hypothetical protein
MKSNQRRTVSDPLPVLFNHTTQLRPPLKVLIDAAQVANEPAFQSSYLSNNSVEASVMTRAPG